MDLEGIKPREISQGQTNTAVFHSYVESKKPKQNQNQNPANLNKQNQTQKYREQTSGYQRKRRLRGG